MALPSGKAVAFTVSPVRVAAEGEGARGYSRGYSDQPAGVFQEWRLGFSGVAVSAPAFAGWVPCRCLGVFLSFGLLRKPSRRLSFSSSSIARPPAMVFTET